MARRLIGLDIGTNAVTVAEVRPGEPPRLDLFGQVALGREVMREGEVADDAAVTDAVSRLRAEVGLKKVAVRLGLASPRVVVRQIEMPTMTREELGSALQFQAAELIPIPLDDAVLDFAILGPASPGDGGEPRMHVLLAAVQEATVLRLVAAVEAGGLQVAAVDLVPLALIRALAGAARDRALVGAAVGAGTTPPTAPAALRSPSAAAAAPRASCRSAAASPRSRCTSWACPGSCACSAPVDASSPTRSRAELDLPPETAEALKRQLGAAPGAEPRHEELVARARGSIERPLSVLLDEVRSSIDYYRNQPDSSPLARIVATGGAAQLPGLTDRLSALVGVPVEDARPRELVALGDIGFADEELPRLDPYLPAAVGLALGGAGVGTVINLLPRKQRTTGSKRPQISPKVFAVGAAFVVGVGGLTFVTQQSLSSAKSKRDAAEQQVARGGVGAQRAAADPRSRDPDHGAAVERSLRALHRRRVADDDQAHHGRPPGRRHADVVLGSGHTARAGRGRSAARGLLVGIVVDVSSSSSSEQTTPTTVPAPVAPVLAGTISFAGIGEGLPDARGVDRRDGQGAADLRRLRHDRAEGGRRHRRAAAGSRSPRPRSSHPAR